MKNFLGDIVNKMPLHDMKVIRFFLAGALNTFLGFFLFPFMYYCLSSYRKDYILMLVVSQIICMLFSFFLNKIYVFKSNNKMSLELIKFLFFYGFYFFISVTINPMIVCACGIHPVVIQTFLNILIVLSSYFWYDKINFTSKKLGNN